MKGILASLVRVHDKDARIDSSANQLQVEMIKARFSEMI